jgi:hypothetical protein
VRYYLTAYIIFWSGLFLYLAWLTGRQAWLNRRAAGLVERLIAQGERGGES